MKTTSKNFLYNVVYHLAIYIIPLIVVPYISRVLGANNIGIYSYVYSIVSYFMLASMLGISNYGSREIAKLEDDKEKMSIKFFSIYWLQLICSIIMVIVYIFMILFVKFSNKTIMLIQLLFLISCAFDINWLFFGLEKFKITISRNLIIKILSLILIFIFVKNKSDLWIYTLIMSSSTLISQMYLWIFLRKEVIFSKVRFSDILSNLKPCLILFIPVVAYSIYRVMDKTMIGAMKNTLELGFYENAEKIISIPLSFISALGTVMLPHMSKSSGEKFTKNLLYSFKLCSFFIFPMTIGLLLISKDFTFIFFGSEFQKSGVIICALLPTIIFGAVSGVIRTNYLIPKSKDQTYVISTVIGAIINFILNFIFIPKFGSLGACLGTIVTEFFIMFYQIIATIRVIEYKTIIIKIVPFIIKSILMGVIIYFVGLFINQTLLKLIIQLMLGIIVYLLLNYKYILYEFFSLEKKS